MRTIECPPLMGRPVPLLIAEIGGNHEGSYEKAGQLCRLALQTGVDAVKFQLYRADQLVNPLEAPDRHAHFRRFELTRDEHRRLAELCAEAGRLYGASVWDLDMLDWVDEYLPFYKIGSGDLTAWPLVREFARRGKPMLLSTGLSTLEEVAATVEFVRRINPGYNDEGRIVLLQCTAMYPLEDADVHLRAMETLRSIPGVSVGFSDHTVGGAALRVAAAMGAQVLEFHFTDRREDRTFRDHKISLLPDEVAQLIEDLRHIGVLRGRAEKIPAAVEQAAGHVASFRRALYPARDLPAGTVLAPGDLVCLRPNVGLDAREVDRVVGRTLACGVKKYQRLAWDLFAPDPRA